VKRFLTSLFAVAILAATAMHSPARALAAENNAKPVAVLSIASYDRIMADVAMVVPADPPSPSTPRRSPAAWAPGSNR